MKQPRPEVSDELMKVVDGINHSGLGKVGLRIEALLLNGK